MKRKLQYILLTWPKSYIRDTDLCILLQCSPDSRYGLIKRAMDAKWLIRLRKGFYLIGEPYQRAHPSLFEMAQLLYGPSYISLESALSYYQWIPEAVYSTTSVTTCHNTQFTTLVGQFSFMRIPSRYFYLGVERIESQADTFLIATPLRALADYLYVYKKPWKTLDELLADLRIEPELLANSDKILMQAICENYPNARIRKQFLALLKELE